MEIPTHLVTYQTAQIIVLMNYERYVAICQPFLFKKKFTSEYRRKCYIIMVILLLLLTAGYIADIISTTFYLPRHYSEYFVRHFNLYEISNLKKIELKLCISKSFSRKVFLFTIGKIENKNSKIEVQGKLILVS